MYTGIVRITSIFKQCTFFGLFFKIWVLPNFFHLRNPVLVNIPQQVLDSAFPGKHSQKCALEWVRQLFPGSGWGYRIGQGYRVGRVPSTHWPSLLVGSALAREGRGGMLARSSGSALRYSQSVLSLA